MIGMSLSLPKTYQMRINFTLAIIATVGLCTSQVQAQTLLYEGFDDVSQLPMQDWSLTNNSDPQGPNPWGQGAGTLGVIAYSGDSLSYLQSGFEATSPTATGTISDWIVSPIVNLENGDIIRLFTVSFNSATFPDRIEVRISTNAGTDVGTAATDVGDFTELVFSVNPNLDTMSYPSAVNGDTWTEFSGAVAGLMGATDCRVAVRYFVTDAGGAGTNSSTVGIDDLEVYRGTSTVGINEASDLVEVVVFPNPATDILNVRTSSNSMNVVTILDAQGKVALTDNFFGTSTIQLQALEAGMYVVEVQDVETGNIFRERVQKH